MFEKILEAVLLIASSLGRIANVLENAPVTGLQPFTVVHQADKVEEPAEDPDDDLAGDAPVDEAPSLTDFQEAIKDAADRNKPKVKEALKKLGVARGSELKKNQLTAANLKLITSIK